jgi:hypothetical protein
MGNALRMALRRCSDDELEILVAKAPTSWWRRGNRTP